VETNQEEVGEVLKRRSRRGRDHFFFADFFPFFFDVFLDVLRAAFLAAMVSVHPLCPLTLEIELKASVLILAVERKVGRASSMRLEHDGGCRETASRSRNIIRRCALADVPR
jgi:hypothetical protein